MQHWQWLLLLFIFCTGSVQADVIYDKLRDRNIPVEISYPVNEQRCSIESKCPVVFLSAGYGVSHTKYSFLAKQLNNLGYLVVAIAHELPQDPPLSVQGDLYNNRAENWIRGASTLSFVRDTLEARYANYAFNALLLVGHSNGGDISAWLANEEKPYVKSIITLDHRRVPLPRGKGIAVLSIRASDVDADDGVLPAEQQRATYNSCIVEIPHSKHNDMSDYGPNWLQQDIIAVVKAYLTGRNCMQIDKA